jgi:hypothetical protein
MRKENVLTAIQDVKQDVKSKTSLQDGIPVSRMRTIVIQHVAPVLARMLRTV